MWENILRNHQNSLKSLFHRSKPSSPDADAAADGSDNSPKPIPQLSPLANSVVSRCSKLFSSLSFPSFRFHFHFITNAFGCVRRILGMSAQELQYCFDSELPLGVKELLTYARQLLEFCSYKALQKLSQNSDFLNDKEFRRLTFDMMLAWEDPSVNTLPVQSVLFSTHSSSSSSSSLLFSSFLHCRKSPVQVKRKPPRMRMTPPSFIQVPLIWRFRF